MTHRKLSVSAMSAYGVGQAAEGFMRMGWGVLLLFYYQQLVGVDSALVGLAIAIALVFDAVSDPIIGAWSDRLHTKWGRRHPMMLVAAIPLALGFIGLFNPPDNLSNWQGFSWLLVFGVLTRFAFTFYHIPHLALGAEMAQDYDQRSTLFAYSAFAVAMSISISYGLITGYYFPTTSEYDPGFLNPDAYWNMSLAFAVVMVVSILLCTVGTRREIPHLREPQVREQAGFIELASELFIVLRNANFRAVFFGVVMYAAIQGIESAFTPFMGVHFWGFTTEDLFYLMFVGWIGFPIAFALTPKLTQWVDKKYSVMIGLAAWVIAVNIPICLRLFEVPWFPGNESGWILFFFLAAATVGALCAPIIAATSDSMLADVADEHELDTTVRREGVIYSVRTFSQKGAAAFGTMIGGILLSVIDFPQYAARGSVDAETVWTLGMIAGPATSIFSIAALLFYFRYGIDRTRYKEIATALELRKSAATTVVKAAD
jgi:Na+/melibiose symporter-like transporter